MKHNLLVTLAVALLFCSTAAARGHVKDDRSASDFLALEVNTFATSSNLWSASYWKKGYPDNMLVGFDLKFGARIRKNWSVFLMTEIPCLVYGRYSSLSVISKANLGVGASRIIALDGWKVFLQPSVSVLSTGFKGSDSYLKPDVEFRVGLNGRFRPYLGLRAEYLYSYNNTARRDFLCGICFGMILL